MNDVAQIVYGFTMNCIWKDTNKPLHTITFHAATSPVWQKVGIVESTISSLILRNIHDNVFRQILESLDNNQS